MNAHPSFIHRGGATPQPGQRTVLFIHGSGHDHSVWALQSRALARQGHQVLAPDLPGHGRSPGPALPSVEAMAAWVLEILESEPTGPCTLIGHSLGSLVALEAAARGGDRVEGLVLLGSTFPMQVNPDLLEMARQDPDQAHALITQWSLSPAALLGNGAQPGISLTGVSRRLMERQAPGVLHTDLTACNAYQHGLETAARVRCPTLLICGSRDQMTPARALAPLREALCHVPGGARMISLPGAGHTMMAEAPGQVLAAIRGFLQEK